MRARRVSAARSLPVGSVLIALALTAGAATAAPAPGATSSPAATGCGTPEKCFARMVRAQSDVASIRARFRQTKHVAMLAEPLVSEGRFSFRRPDTVRWEMESPEPMVVEIEGGKLRAGPPGGVADVDAGPATALFRDLGMLFTGADDYAGKRFTLGPGTLGPDSFTLTPKDASVGRIVAAIEIALDPQTGGPRQAVIRETGGDRTDIVLSQVEVERASAAEPRA
jgi:outer membrane lipoprotein-sorting protein